MLGNFVFDIDGAIAIAVDYEPAKKEQEVKDKFGDAFLEKHQLTAYNYPHYIFPGYYALFKWLHLQGGKIFFFSSGIEARNIELAEKMIKKSFGDETIDYKVFSRKHCIDTRKNREESKEKYQSFFFGNRKKKLAGIVVPENEISNSLLIEDDSSYMTKGEEFNLDRVHYNHMYVQHDAYSPSGTFSHFHNAYYLAGLFSKIFETKDEQNISLVEAAKYVQIDLEGRELNRDFYYPSLKKLDYYINGKAILQQIDPSLEFYYKVPETITDY